MSGSARANVAVPTVSTDVEGAEWDAYVAAHAESTRYHEWKWRELFESVFGHETIYLAARRGRDIAGVLPLVAFRSRVFGRFAVSLPFVNVGGVCADDAAAADELVTAAAAIGEERGWTHIELRHTARRFPQLSVRQHKVEMRLPLATSTADAWKALDYKMRNHIRKAEKCGLTAREGGVELVDRFYPVFARNMRDLGTPVYAKRLFEQVVAAFPDRARVFLVDRGPLTIAGGIALCYRDDVEVPWASSIREYRSECPNNLLYWAVIQSAIARGLRTMDFGRSTPDEGTYQFKKQWGAKPEPLHWEYVLARRRSLPDLTPTNRKFQLAIGAWKRLPVAVATRIGPHIIRSIP